MGKYFRPLKAAKRLSAKAYNAVLKSVEFLQRIKGIAGLRTGPTPTIDSGGIQHQSSVYQPFYARIIGSDAPLATVFAASTDANAETITVAGTDHFPRSAPFFVIADGEMIEVLDSDWSGPGNGTTIWTVARGVNGTAPKKHDQGDLIESVTRPYFWIEVQQESQGVWLPHLEGRCFVEPHNSESLIPAYEVKGSHLVPTDGSAIVQMWVGYDTQTYYLFEYFPQQHAPDRLFARIIADYGPIAETNLLADIDESQEAMVIFCDGKESFPEADKLRPFDVVIDSETVKVTKTGDPKLIGPQVWFIKRAQYNTPHNLHRRGAKVATVALKYGHVEVVQDKAGVWQDVKDGPRNTVAEYSDPKKKKLKSLRFFSCEERAWRRVPIDGSVIVEMKPGFNNPLEPEPTKKATDGVVVDVSVDVTVGKDPIKEGGQAQYYLFSYWPQAEGPFWARIVGEGPPPATAYLTKEAKVGDLVLHVNGTDCFPLTGTFGVRVPCYRKGPVTELFEMDRGCCVDKIEKRASNTITVELPIAVDLPVGAGISASHSAWGFVEVMQEIGGNWLTVKGGRQSRHSSDVTNWDGDGLHASKQPFPETRSKWVERGDPPDLAKLVPRDYEEGGFGSINDEGHGTHINLPGYPVARLLPPPNQFVRPCDPTNTALDYWRPPAYEVNGDIPLLGDVVQMWPGYHQSPMKLRDGPWPNAADYYIFKAKEKRPETEIVFPKTKIPIPIENIPQENKQKTTHKGPQVYFPRRYTLYPGRWNNFLIPWGSKWEFNPYGHVYLTGLRLAKTKRVLRQDWPANVPPDPESAGPGYRVYTDGKGFQITDKGGQVLGAIGADGVNRGPESEGGDGGASSDGSEAAILTAQGDGAGVLTPTPALPAGDPRRLDANGSPTADGAVPADNVPDPYLDPLTLADYLPEDGQQLIIHNGGPGYLTLPHNDLGSYPKLRMHFASGEDYTVKPCETVILEYSTKACPNENNPKDPYKTPDEPTEPGRWTLDTGQQAYPKECHLAYRCVDAAQEPQRGSGTITQSGTTVTGLTSRFLSEVIVGDTIRSPNRTINSEVTAIASDTSLTVSTSTTESAGQPYEIVPRTEARRGTGTATQSGFTVSGTGSLFTTEVLPGDTLTGDLPSNPLYGRVQSIESDTSLTVDSNQTVASTIYTIRPPEGLQGSGVVAQEGTVVTGVGTKFLDEAHVGDKINGGSALFGTITEILSNTVLKLNRSALVTRFVTYTIATTLPREYRAIRVQDRGRPGGVATLTRTGRLSLNQLAIGTPTTSRFLRGDGTWAAIPSFGGGDMLAPTIYTIVVISGTTTCTYLINGIAWNSVTGAGPYTITLYSPAGAGVLETFIGFLFHKNLTGTITIETPAGVIVAPGTTLTTRTFTAGQTVVLMSDGTDWQVVSETHV